MSTTSIKFQNILSFPSKIVCPSGHHHPSAIPTHSWYPCAQSVSVCIYMLTYSGYFTQVETHSTSSHAWHFSRLGGLSDLYIILQLYSVHSQVINPCIIDYIFFIHRWKCGSFLPLGYYSGLSHTSFYLSTCFQLFKSYLRVSTFMIPSLPPHLSMAGTVSVYCTPHLQGCPGQWYKFHIV